MAIQVVNLLGRDGGIDWAGFDWAVAYLGIEDIEPVIDAIRQIKQHKPEE